MFTRLGAVTELRARMLSADLSAALGAYQALVDVRRSDIRIVQEFGLGGPRRRSHAARSSGATLRDG